MLLDAGDYVPADGRLLDAGSLKVDEGMLTGESTSAEKEVTDITSTVPIGDRTNMVFSGTIVTYGRGKFLVTSTGNNTEIGQVAGLLESTTEQVTPLQRGLDKFSKTKFGYFGIVFIDFRYPTVSYLSWRRYRRYDCRYRQRSDVCRSRSRSCYSRSITVYRNNRVIFGNE